MTCLKIGAALFLLSLGAACSGADVSDGANPMAEDTYSLVGSSTAGLEKLARVDGTDGASPAPVIPVQTALTFDGGADVAP
jgi:hypothetical protein